MEVQSLDGVMQVVEQACAAFAHPATRAAAEQTLLARLRPHPPPPRLREGAPAPCEHLSVRLRAPPQAFRNSAASLPACRYVLERSASLDACFQAAATLRSAALRDWRATPPSPPLERRRWLGGWR